MTLVLEPPPGDALAAQRSASDPRASAWVSANAGSGKTRVLTDRVIRLLLHGVEPARILCLTYTKAAAANMANRVFETLGQWARLDGEALAAAVGQVEGRNVGPHELAGARRLFARALECPGGLKVQTIHAFSEHLLHLFPFEAGTPASFSVLDDAQTVQLLAEARLATARAALDWPDGPLGRASRRLAQQAGEGMLDALLREAIMRRHDIAALFEAEGGLEGALSRLARDLGLDDGDSLEALDRELFSSPVFPQSLWADAIAALEGSGARDREQAARLAACLACEGEKRVRTYLSIFLTGDGEFRAKPLTGSFAVRHPALAGAFAAEAERLARLIDRRRALATHEATAALLTVAEAVIETYARLKRARARLDFDDLVHRVRRLLSDERAAWVLYKLDGGIDHILIDEAQDTSPAQWAIVEALGSEFFVGESARSALERTMFAVGDEKQSIYSFQGARPQSFDEMRRRFDRRARDAGRAFREVRLVYSFRSTQHVLAAVDRVFSRPEALCGLTAAGIAPTHQAVRLRAPGFVEIWPLVAPEPADDGPAWDAPFDARAEESPVERLARRIASTIRGWLDEGAALDTGRRIEPEDVLILVQRRNSLFEAIIRALKAADVPVAGADRLKLNEHIAVMDCLAAADFALLPEDDLTLATVLRSPLVGLDEDTLFTLAHGRDGSLWQALIRAAARDATLEPIRERLATWLDRADFVRPFEFFSDLLGTDGGRRRLLARLGPEAADALDELVNLALAYEEAATPSLQGFLWWLRSTSREVKRTLDLARGEVRVMTVHNAKGLEAPVVFLADTLSVPEAQKAPKLAPVAPRREIPGQAPALAWRGVADRDPQPVAAACEAAIEAQRAEHRRLLYVAMTRAADRLYVCGHQGLRKRADGNWYDLIHAGLGAQAREVRGPDGAVTAWRWTAGDMPEPAPCSRRAVAPVEERPAWLDGVLPVERVAKPLVASSLLIATEAEEADKQAAEDGLPPEEAARRLARERGTLVHRLLQTLPDLDPPLRRAAGERFLEARAAALDPGLRRRLVRIVLSLLADPAFAPVFAAGSKAEVPVAGLLTVDGEERPVSGIIDRLTVLPDRVLIVDFKTHRDPPETIERAPRAYLAQLAAYRRLLMSLYPDRPVEAALLWTAVPRLDAAPSGLLDGALSSG